MRRTRQALLAGLVLAGLLLAGTAGAADKPLSGDEQLAQRIEQAIKADDSAALEKALQACGARCEPAYDDLLLAATLRGAHETIILLVSHDADPTPGETSSAVATCMGVYEYRRLRLEHLNSLAVSVAMGDKAAFEALLARAAPEGVKQAAWVAAQRDRLEFLKALIEKGAGAPLIMRSPDPIESGTLLTAAASGGALRVGAWLLDEKGFDADSDPVPLGGVTPLLGLVEFGIETRGSPRLEPFLAMLLAHGAHLDRVSPITGRTPLQEATLGRSPAAFDALVAAGASQASLSPEDRERAAAFHRDPWPADTDFDRPECWWSTGMPDLR